MNTKMTLPELVAALKAEGFTHVRTFGPMLPLDEWNPYGVSPGGANWVEGGKPYYGEILKRDGETVVRDWCDDNELRRQCGLVLGIWRFALTGGC